MALSPTAPWLTGKALPRFGKENPKLIAQGKFIVTFGSNFRESLVSNRYVPDTVFPTYLQVATLGDAAGQRQDDTADGENSFPLDPTCSHLVT